MADSKEVTAADVREWAKAQGIECGIRGRISADLAKAYNRGHRAKYVTKAEANA